MGEKDDRGTLIRIRLSDEDLARVTAIQEHYQRVGIPDSMQRVISDAIDSHYSILEAEGAVPPNI